MLPGAVHRCRQEDMRCLGRSGFALTRTFAGQRVVFRSGSDKSMDGEMFDRQFTVDEIPIVFWIKHGLVDVITGEPHDRLAVVPKADRQELRAVTIWSADYVRAPVPRCSLVFDDAGGEDVVGVDVGIFRASPASPRSYDH